MPGRRAAACPGRSGCGRRLEPLLLAVLLLAASGAAAAPAGGRRHQEAEAEAEEKQAKRVRWYLNFGLVEANLAFHAEHRDIVAGGLLCCHSFAFDLSDAGKTRFQVGKAVPQQVESYQQGGLEDLWVVTGISAEAIAAGRHDEDDLGPRQSDLSGPPRGGGGGLGRAQGAMMSGITGPEDPP